ncbi:MAG: MFS transporter [Myxococcales bacterium]|nr:MFS transporter [Myxococcales bacterium]
MPPSSPATASRFGALSRRVLVAGFVASSFSVGLSIYLFGVFQDEIVQGVGISVGQYSWAPTLASLTSGLLSPIVGRLLATHGRPGLAIPRVMIAGGVSMGLGLLAISRIESPWLLPLAFTALVAPGTVMMGPLAASAMVTNWFASRRGRALGLVAAGTTVGGMLAPPIAAGLIEALGWRAALGVLGVSLFLVPVPIVAAFARTSPEEEGEHPDGVDPAASGPGGVGAAAIEGPATTGQLLRDRDFWLIGIVFGLVFASGSIGVAFTIPYASQLGLPLVGGAAIGGARAGAAALGKVLLGGLSDRLGVRRVLLGVIGAQALLVLLLIRTRDPVLFTLLGVGAGFVGGASLPLKSAMIGQAFGRASFASAMGLAQTVALPFAALLRVAGAVHDRTGDYANVFALTIPILLLAAVVLLFVRAGGVPETGIAGRR